MPISRSTSLRRALLCTLGAALLAPALASASIPGELRVVTQDGRQLADVRQYTDTSVIPTSPQAKCFFGGKGGSGKPVAISGSSALGIVNDAAQSLPSLRPLLVTDEFSFGLGVCGFGGVSSGPSNFWQIRVNHRATQVAADQTHIGGGDEVLWALVPNPICDSSPPFACQPTEPELSLEAPARALAGQPFAVRVIEYSDTGVSKPASGVAVTGAAAPTDASGAATVTLSQTGSIVGSRAGSIPTQQLAVCVGAILSQCPRHRGRLIYGSDGDDVIRGTPGPDVIYSRGGTDLIKVRGGGADIVKCGSKTDIVFADRRDKIGKRCKHVFRSGGHRKHKK